MPKIPLGTDVLTAAKERIEYIFDTFSKVYVAFSGGKDSTVMLHLTMDEAIRRNQKVGILFVDFEGQYKLTIDHILEMEKLYHDNIEMFWVALPITLRNAVSVYEPKWTCWEPSRKNDWIRKPPKIAITDQNFFNFYEYDMEFEDFVPRFGKWYARGELTACLVGIRSDESLNRFRTLAMKGKQRLDNKQWTTYVQEGETVYNCYPIYDWKTRDIWIYNGKHNKPYNKLYDYMYKAGLSIHQQRICQPYGDDQRKGLWLFHIIEPKTWSRVVARVNGANQGAMYATNTGNILGNIKITKPDNHTWESFAHLLLDSMPPKTSDHFKDKIAVFLNWWMNRGYRGGIPDEADHKLEASKKAPSWRRICKALLRNDYWCKGLSFSQHTTGAYERYKKMMKRRRAKWGII